MSEQLYSIKETTLTDIGDALRRKHGETKIIQVEELIPTVLTMSTTNATDFDSFTGSYSQTSKKFGEISFNGASKIRVEVAYDLPSGQTLYIDSGSHTYASDMEVETRMECRGKGHEIRDFDDDVVTFYFDSSNYASVNLLGFYAECVGLDENGMPMGEIGLVNKEITNKYSSDEFAQAIDDIQSVDMPDEAFILSGDCSYRFSQTGWNWFLDLYGDKITTVGLTNTSYMFTQNTTIEEVPFDINIKTNITLPNMEYMFSNCQKLEKFPKFNNTTTITTHIKFGNMFNSCYRMTYIPDGIIEILKEDYELTSKTNNNFAPWGSMFGNCYSLREVPPDVIKYMKNQTQNGYYYGLAYSKPFGGCACLEKLENIYPEEYSLTTNQWGSWFSGLYRLSKFTFATQEDGTPYTRNWKSQTLELMYSGKPVGVSNGNNNILKYNSGITADKEVTDDATYQALKDNPDWFTTKSEYSRYNHDSAVETINSLPDTSAFGTNIIKFKGDAGSLTDGGAINTMTAEEIAIASAKGWTVTLV